MDLFTLIGLSGFATYVGSYALLQLGLLDGNGAPYTLANVAAAGMVLIGLIDQFNLASALIQIAWICFGVAGLVLRVRRRTNVASTPDIEGAARARIVRPARHAAEPTVKLVEF